MRASVIVCAFALSLLPITQADGQENSEAKLIKLLEKANQSLEGQVKALRSENEKFKKKIAELEAQLKKVEDTTRRKADKDAKDPFAAGTIWNGTRYYTHKPGKTSPPQDWQLVITERAGNSFKGEVKYIAIFTDKKPVSYDVKGKAPAKGNGRITFKSVQRGARDHQYKGFLSNGQISLEFSGTGHIGGRVRGKATLKQ